MKSIMKLLFITTVIVVLSACNNQAAAETETINYIYGVAIGNTEVEMTWLQIVRNMLDYGLVEQIDITGNENINIIDHVFSKAINDALPPFYFRVLA